MQRDIVSVVWVEEPAEAELGGGSVGDVDDLNERITACLLG